MDQFIFNTMNLLNLLLIFLIVILFSHVILNKKYDAIASILFLNRGKIKKSISIWYFGITLLFAEHVLHGLFSGLSGQLMKITGLYTVLFLSIGVYTTFNMKAFHFNKYVNHSMAQAGITNSSMMFSDVDSEECPTDSFELITPIEEDMKEILDQIGLGYMVEKL